MAQLLYLSLLAISGYLYIFKLKNLGRQMFLIFCMRNITKISIYQNILVYQTFEYIGVKSYQYTAWDSIFHVCILVFNEQFYQSSNKHAFCYLCPSNRRCRHMRHKDVCRNKSVSNSQKKHEFHISFFASEPADKYKLGQSTCQTHMSYTNLDTNLSHKNSLHLLQTTTSNIKAKQKLTCVHTFSLLECSSCRFSISLTTAVTIHTQHTFGVDTLLSEGAQYDLSTTALETFRIRIQVHQMNPQSLTTELRSTYVKRKIDNIAQYLSLQFIACVTIYF